jgi:hypothetical protein
MVRVADELENYLEECGRCLNDVLSWHLPAETEENHNQDNRSPDLDLNPNRSVKR